MTRLERHRMPEEPDPDEVTGRFGIEAAKERAGPVVEEEPPGRPPGAPAPASEVDAPGHDET